MSPPGAPVRPGELLLAPGEVELSAGRPRVELTVANTSRHPVFVGSHYPFFEVNRRLVFDRARAFGMHLDIPAGDAVGWRPGEVKTVRLVGYGGRRVVTGFHGLTDGPATPERLEAAMARVLARGFGHRPTGTATGRPTPGGEPGSGGVPRPTTGGSEAAGRGIERRGARAGVSPGRG